MMTKWILTLGLVLGTCLAGWRADGAAQDKKSDGPKDAKPVAPGQANPSAQPSSDQIVQWIKDLGDGSYPVREKATRDLHKAGRSAVKALIQVARTGDVEVQNRAKIILDRIETDVLGGKMKRVTWFRHRIAYEVDLKGTPTTDEDLLLLGRSKRLHHLDLSFTPVTDKDIVHLSTAPELVTLELMGTKVTDKAIAHLRRIPALNSINLAQTAVTHKGIELLVRGKSYDVALGAKAQFRVHQSYYNGKLDYNYLMIGDTHFGMYLAGNVRPSDAPVRDRRREATAYYHRHGPVGQVMNRLEWFKPASVLDYPSDVRMPASLLGLLANSGTSGTMHTGPLAGLWTEPAIAVVRLGVGSHAAYGRLGQHIHFYHSTPEIKAFSLPTEDRPPYFGYVSDAMRRGCAVMVFDGDERPTLSRKSPKKFYSALFVEITRNDLRDINTNLLTKEAVADMINALTETGLLCFHTSQRAQT